MVAKRACCHPRENGEACQAKPQRERPFCFFHDPDQAAEVAQSRRLGGQRRKREATVSGAYDFEGLRGPEDVRRLLEIAAYDALALDNSVPRVRALIALGSGAVKLFEVTELEERLLRMEAALEGRTSRKRGGSR